jgi:hypothetical protein
MLISRRPMRLVAASVALSGLLGALPAAGETHYFCYLHDAYEDRGFYMSPILSTGADIDETWTGTKFYEYASAQQLPMDAGSIKYGCVSSPNLGYVREQQGRYPEWHPGMLQVDWPEPPVPSVPAEPFTPTDALVIEEAPPSGPSPEVLAAWRESDRRAAAENARKLAASLRADAELQAQYEASRRKYRRRAGSQ